MVLVKLLFLFSFSINLYSIDCRRSIEKLNIESKYLLENTSRIMTAFAELNKIVNSLATPVSHDVISIKLLESKVFKDFIKEYEYSYDETFDIDKYLFYLKNIYFSNKNIQEKQLTDLVSFCRSHGLITNKSNVYKDIKKKSVENKDRILENYVNKLKQKHKDLKIPYNDLRIMSEYLIDILNTKSKNQNKVFNEISSLIMEMEFKYTHYAVHSPTKETSILPVLSSRVLEDLNVGKGINSQHTFTKNFLKSDNFVFFGITPVSRNNKISASNKMYGNLKYILDNTYAEKNGVISITLMKFNNGFTQFSEVYQNELFKEISIKGKATGLMNNTESLFALYGRDNLNTDTRYILDRLESIREKLYILDFKPKDFIDLTQKLLLLELFKYRLNGNNQKYNEISSALKSTTPLALNKAINKFINRGILNVPFFELQMPTLVPIDKVQKHNEN